MKTHLQSIVRSPQTMEGRRGFLCMDRNERIDPFPPAVWESIVAHLTPEMMCHYPDGSDLVAKLAKKEDLPASKVYLTNGSDAGLRMIFQAFLEPGDRVIAASPTYAMVSVYSQIFDGILEEVPYDKDRRVNIEAFCGPKPARLVVLANPDQPTGGILGKEQIRRVANAVAEKGGFLIVDEAYYPFHDDSAVDLVREGLPVAVTRSFSKWMGIPGLRLGYLLASDEIVDGVQKIRGAHEVNGIAIAVGSYLLDHPEIPDEYAAEIELGRASLQELGKLLGFKCPPCPANFQLLDLGTPERASALVESLRKKKILVKGDFQETCLSSCVRITLGGKNSMPQLLKTLESVWGDLPHE